MFFISGTGWSQYSFSGLNARIDGVILSEMSNLLGIGHFEGSTFLIYLDSTGLSVRDRNLRNWSGSLIGMVIAAHWTDTEYHNEEENTRSDHDITDWGHYVSNIRNQRSNATFFWKTRFEWFGQVPHGWATKTATLVLVLHELDEAFDLAKLIIGTLYRLS